MLPENDRFKIVTSGWRHPSCPNLTSETKYFILLRFACQMRTETAIGVGCGNMRSGSHEYGPPGGRIRQGKYLMASADSESGAALQEEVDVAAELGGELAEALERKGTTGEHGKTQQYGGGITGAAAQTGAHRDALDEVDLDFAGDAHGRKREPGRADGEVIGNRKRVVDFNRRFSFRREDELQPVGQGDGLKNRAQLVIAIRPFAENAQIQIDFCQRAEAGPPGSAAHLSYLIRENTS